MLPHSDAQPSEMQQGYGWIWSAGCETPATTSTTSAPVENANPANKTTPPQFEVVDVPPPSPCHTVGGPDVTAIGLRLLAATALCGAAFLVAGKWNGV